MNRISFLTRGYAFKGLLAVPQVGARITLVNVNALAKARTYGLRQFQRNG